MTGQSHSSLLMRHIAFTTVSGVPLFLQRVPVLGGLLRGISMRAISRLLEDVNSAVSLVRVRAGYPSCCIHYNENTDSSWLVLV